MLGDRPTTSGWLAVCPSAEGLVQAPLHDLSDAEVTWLERNLTSHSDFEIYKFQLILGIHSVTSSKKPSLSSA
jgi:hypothetical protein